MYSLWDKNYKNLDKIWLIFTVSSVTETDMIRSSTGFSVNNLSCRRQKQKNGIVIKNYVKTDLKQKKGILLSQFYYKVSKNKGSIFFQAVCEAAILHISFLYSWTDR